MKSIIIFVVSIFAKLGILTPIRVAKLKFWYKIHRWPNFEHPKDVNEKINWMKFYGDTSQWSVLADKYAVRKFVAEKIGKEHLVPMVGRWNKVEDIDWDSLPQQFVMKCNNGSGDVVVCDNKNKLDIEETKKHFSKCLNEKLSVVSGEPHYAAIKPCIIAEELLDSSSQPCNSSSLVDYKVWCFNGEPRFVFCYWNRKGFYANIAVYDMDWQSHPEYIVWSEHYTGTSESLPKPKCFDNLIVLAKKLSTGFPIVRVDMYIVNNNIFFGEITLTPAGGYMEHFTQDFLLQMGELTKLPIDN